MLLLLLWTLNRNNLHHHLFTPLGSIGATQRPPLVAELPLCQPNFLNPDVTVARLAALRHFLWPPMIHILYMLPVEESPASGVLQTVCVTSVVHGQLSKFSLLIAFKLSWGKLRLMARALVLRTRILLPILFLLILTLRLQLMAEFTSN